MYTRFWLEYLKTTEHKWSVHGRIEDNIITDLGDKECEFTDCVQLGHDRVQLGPF